MGIDFTLFCLIGSVVFGSSKGMVLTVRQHKDWSIGDASVPCTSAGAFSTYLPQVGSTYPTSAHQDTIMHVSLSPHQNHPHYHESSTHKGHSPVPGTCDVMDCTYVLILHKCIPEIHSLEIVTTNKDRI